ncbi:MAG: SPOR domain-containing protein [Peptococcaceae bacterium]|nr:SPOR domain-containing protein [Peptococcaceae bacterium]
MKKNRYFKGLITVFLVIIGVCGIGWFTWHLGRMFVGLVSTNMTNSPAEVQASDSRILNLPDIVFWTCQVGVFKDHKNVEAQLESLSRKGWKAAVLTEEPYTVAVGSFAGKEDALALSSLLAKDGIEAWVKEVSFPALHYKVNGKNTEEVIRILTLSNSLLREPGNNSVPDKAKLVVESVFTSECPSDFAQLKHALVQVLTTPDANDDHDYTYNQNILNLYAEYKQVTTKFFTEKT